MSTTPLHCAVIGAGPMGLAAACRLARQGHRVTVVEADVVSAEKGVRHRMRERLAKRTRGQRSSGRRG